jgi:hypothetical protein
MGRAADYAREIGISVDPTDAEAFESGRMNWDEYQHRQQRRAAPNPYSPEDIASGASKGSTATEAASGWDGKTSAQSSRTDEHGNSVPFDAPTQSPRDSALQQVSQVYTSTPAPTAGAQGGPANDLRSILMQQLGVLGSPVSANDPSLAPQFQAQRLASQREADRARMVASELRGAQGLGDSGALDADITGIDERRAEQNLMMQSDTLSRETDQRRRALLAALGLGFQDEQADNGLGFNYAQLGQQGSQFDRALDQDDTHFNLNLDQRGDQFDRTLAQNNDQFGQNLGFQYAGLNQQGNQFNDQQGYNWAALEQSGNLQALLALLGAA